MGGLKLFIIRFDNPYGVYYAGQLVSGNVTVKLDSPKKSRGITLKFKGEGEVKWDETSGTGDDRKTHTYSNSETYFETKLWVFGNGAEIELPPGEHIFPFNFMLPVHIPSSFEAEFGHVRYTAKAIMDRPWRFDHEAKAAITVLAVADLNTDPRALEPSRGEKSKNFCCWCCADGPLTVTASVGKSGYVPGEMIPISCSIENASGKTINNVKVELHQEVIFQAEGRKKTTEQHLVKLQLGTVAPNSSQDFTGENIQVPPVPPSDLTYCSIIGIKYTLKFEANPSGLGMALKVDLPVIIGTIPIRQYNPEYQPPPPETGSVGFVPTAPTLQDYPNMPPPSYQEATGGTKFSIRDKDDNEHTGGDMDFTPRYATFNIGFQNPQ